LGMVLNAGRRRERQMAKWKDTQKRHGCRGYTDIYLNIQIRIVVFKS